MKPKELGSLDVQGSEIQTLSKTSRTDCVSKLFLKHNC